MGTFLRGAQRVPALGEKNGAVREYTEAVKLMPVFPSLRTLLGQALWKAGKREAAIAELEAALKIDPDCAPALEGLKVLKY